MRQKQKKPNSRDGESGREPKPKYFRQPHFTKNKRRNPPRYDKKFDREILEGFAEKFRGSIIGQLADERLRELP